MEEVSRCKSCGELDTIYHTSDCGYCQECHSVENYEYITEEEAENE